MAPAADADRDRFSCALPEGSRERYLLAFTIAERSNDCQTEGRDTRQESGEPRSFGSHLSRMRFYFRVILKMSRYISYCPRLAGRIWYRHRIERNVRFQSASFAVR